MAIDPARAKSLFLAASDLKNPAERAAFLVRECGKDVDLRARVEALLRANDAAPISKPAESIASDAAVTGTFEREAPATGEYSANHEHVGTIIAGRYKLLEEIGEGGMGTVWVTEQLEPVRRKVALKLVKPGMDSRSVLARFEAERQALALMDHPNIAKVLDGGLTAAGRPFFAMEYVRGIRITEYCDSMRLSIPDRLKLFVQVCSAVQHAHQKGIIHRDLKPSNILVAPYDDSPVPKVIDFGLAKATHQPLTELTLHTAHETVLGTPLYMSPEQAQLNNLDVDTRTDVYSLGILLYELLTGSTPLEQKRVKEAEWDEVRRLIREEEPPQPSARLSSTNTLPILAVNRQTEPVALTRLLRGELDWIVMKALEKDRTRRYATANGLAQDVQRYLADEIVEARPPSNAYRLRKFMRRHRGQVLAASLVALALVVGFAGTTFGLVRAENLRVEAETRREEAVNQKLRAEAGEKLAADRLTEVDAERKRAEEGKQTAEDVKDFLENKLLRWKADEESARLPDKLQSEMSELLRPTVLRDMLKRADRELKPDRIEATFPGRPLLQAELLSVLGSTYLGTHQPKLGVDCLIRSANLRKGLQADDHPDMLKTLFDLGCAYLADGEFQQGTGVLEQVRDAQIKKLGPDHGNSIMTSEMLALGYFYLKNYLRGIEVLEQVREVHKKLGTDDITSITTTCNLACMYGGAGKLTEALALFEEAATRVEKVNFRYMSSGWILQYTVQACEKAGEHDRAEIWRKKWQVAATRLPEGAAYSPALEQKISLCRDLLKQNKYAQAEPLLRECELLFEKAIKKGENQPGLWRLNYLMAMRGHLLLGQNKTAEAETHLIMAYNGLLENQSIAANEEFRHERLSYTIRVLIDLYEVTNKPDEVKKWQAELAKYPFPQLAPMPREMKR